MAVVITKELNYYMLRIVTVNNHHMVDYSTIQEPIQLLDPPISQYWRAENPIIHPKLFTISRVSPKPSDLNVKLSSYWTGLKSLASVFVLKYVQNEGRIQEGWFICAYCIPTEPNRVKSYHFNCENTGKTCYYRMMEDGYLGAVQ
ncbi:unnamed protein product, partial [Allacma fusca]